MRRVESVVSPRSYRPAAPRGWRTGLAALAIWLLCGGPSARAELIKYTGTFTAEHGSYPVAPEPSTLAIAGLGALGLLGYRRTRRSA